MSVCAFVCECMCVCVPVICDGGGVQQYVAYVVRPCNGALEPDQVSLQYMTFPMLKPMCSETNLFWLFFRVMEDGGHTRETDPPRP